MSYKNPLNQPKTLYLRTDSPHLLQFKESILETQPMGTAYIGLRFLPITTLGAAELLVFLNDEADKTEECLCIKLQYT